MGIDPNTRPHCTKIRRHYLLLNQERFTLVRKVHSKKVAAYCNQCRKFLYRSRSDAKKVAKVHSDRHMNVYPCPMVPHMFHVGHLADSVVQGRMSRNDVYGKGVA
jgi:hypothetical protein